MTTSTPLYHATIGGMSGLMFHVGDTVCFTSMDDPTIYQVTQVQCLTLTEVDASMAAHLTATIVEPRLLALTGGRR